MILEIEVQAVLEEMSRGRYVCFIVVVVVSISVWREVRADSLMSHRMRRVPRACSLRVVALLRYGLSRSWVCT